MYYNYVIIFHLCIHFKHKMSKFEQTTVLLCSLGWVPSRFYRLLIKSCCLKRGSALLQKMLPHQWKCIDVLFPHSSHLSSWKNLLHIQNLLRCTADGLNSIFDAQKMNQFWTFYVIFFNNFKYFLEADSLLKNCKIVLEYTLKCSQPISS